MNENELVLLLILSILIGVYVIGGFFAALLMGWDYFYVKDLLKVIIWPITIFFEK